jgi:hypothetical protein
METPSELWQVDIEGALYEADTETLKQWILDGYVFPETKVQKGSLKWIELRRVPTFRGLFAAPEAGPPPFTAPAATGPSSAEPAPAADVGWAPPPSMSHGYTPVAPLTAAAAAGCANHPAMRARYMCQSCGASLCTTCVRRYGTTAVCTLCGQLCQPIAEAAAKLERQAVISKGYGLRDFALAVQYPLKDPIALAITACLYGFLLLFGIYGRFAAAGLMFAYISHAIRRVSMGHYDEGPSPDLSDPADLIFNAGKIGIAVMLITLGPLVAVILFGVSSFDELDLTTIASVGIGVILAGLWAIFYYPMALLVSGYTGEFLATINPIVGIATMMRLGLDYAKAYFMWLVVFILQTLISASIAVIGAASEAFTNTIIQAVAYLVQYILQGAVSFFASMVAAALLGLVLYKRPDVVDLEV